MIEDIGEQWVKYITRPIAGAGGLLAAVHRRRLVAPLLPFAVAFVILLAWWSTIEASNDRVWQPDVAMLSSAEIEGDVITLYNVRRFTIVP